MKIYGANRPGVVWIFTLLIVAGILWELFGFYAVFTGQSDLSLTTPVVIGLVFNAVLLLLRGVMIYHFFLLHASAKFWTHVSFGASLGVYVLYRVISTFLQVNLVYLSASILALILYAVFWWIVVDYINNKEVDGEPLFS